VQGGGSTCRAKGPLSAGHSVLSVISKDCICSGQRVHYRHVYARKGLKSAHVRTLCAVVLKQPDQPT